MVHVARAVVSWFELNPECSMRVNASVGDAIVRLAIVSMLCTRKLRCHCVETLILPHIVKLLIRSLLALAGNLRAPRSDWRCANEDTMSHGHASHSPHQKPDRQLQAQPFVQLPNRSITGVGEGVHIRGSPYTTGYPSPRPPPYETKPGKRIAMKDNHADRFAVCVSALATTMSSARCRRQK